MGRRFYSGAGNEGIITKVNVTPIIDVALVLVIILLVTAPLLSVADLPVDLPQARTREAEDERNVSVTLGSDGSMAVDEERVAPGALTGVLQAHLAKPGNDDVLVVVRADSGAPYSRVREILEQTRAAGAKRVAIATRQDTKKTEEHP
jgi:biopolymer transport protein TolR